MLSQGATADGPTQLNKFKNVIRELETDDNPSGFQERLRKLVNTSRWKNRNKDRNLAAESGARACFGAPTCLPTVSTSALSPTLRTP
jgi:hypothetical protein